MAGHSGAGKTTLVEALLYLQKAIDRPGSVTAGTTVSDYDPEEVRRQHSITTSLIPIEYKGVKVNFLDLPGRMDFIGEIKNSIRVSDALLFVLDATAGIEVGTEFAADYANEL